MALNALGLGFVFTAKDLASGTITSLTKNFDALDKKTLEAQANYQGSLAIMGTGIAAMGVGLGVLAGGFALASHAAEFTAEITKVGGIAQATAADLQKLHDAAINAGMFSMFNPREAAEGLGELASAGFNANESIRLLTPTLNLAAAGSISVAQSAASVAAGVKVFGLSMDDAATVADRFVRISNSTNLSAADLEISMGNIARGAQAANQGINEMLPAIGLVKNSGVDASVAATSVSSALLEMGKNAKGFKQIGVEVTDANGQFRPFLDVIMDANQQLSTRFPNAAARAAKATELFGRFGLQAYGAISGQLAQGVRDSTGALHQNADAVAFLRSEMEGATGAAAALAAAQQATFAGQQRRFATLGNTLGTVLGEGFERALLPLLTLINDGLQSVTEFINDIPVEVRGGIGQVVMVIGGLVTAFGAVTAAIGAWGVLAPFIATMKVAAVGLAGSIAPIVLGALAVGAAFMTLRYMVQNNVGGIADFVTAAWGKIKLVFQAFTQAFSSGTFSGAVRDELNKAENGGIKQFVVNVYAFGFRVMQFFRGIKAGFTAVLDTMGPTIERLQGAFTKLAGAFGIGGDALGVFVSGPSSDFMAWGAQVGDILGRVADVVLSAVTVVIDILGSMFSGLSEGFGDTMVFIKPTLDMLMESFGGLGAVFNQLLEAFGISADVIGDGTSGWQTFGKVVGWVAGTAIEGVIVALTMVVETIKVVIGWVTGLVMAFTKAWGYIKFVGVSMYNIFANAIDQFAGLLETMLSGFARILSILPAGIRPEWAEGVADELSNSVNQRAVRVQERRSNSDAMYNAIQTSPAAAEQVRNDRQSSAQSNALLSMSRTMEEQARQRERPLAVTVNMDGETVGRITSRANQGRSEASFTPSDGGMSME